MIEEIVSAESIRHNRWRENAHTRRMPSYTDIVVRAGKKVSGRLQQCIPIGEYRSGAYRVKRNILGLWGDLTVRDGYLQRSARLPAFRDTAKFYECFLGNSPSFLQKNN
ncbi:MAG: hypothetical protein DMF24_11425 [Verrucomicrobia bacterium]|nr:MAG: hypothetical protein DME90_02270 [Verrucomicrobiota bacterium]PYL60016.1 MAG: hypothetical protein DMF24_11425 [Verrucomicrobiota bacterium]